MQQQFTKTAQLVVAIIAVATIASLATAVVTLSRSGDGADVDGLTRFSPGQFDVEQSGESLGSEVGDLVTPSDRGALRERSNVMFSTREGRGRVKGQVFLDMFVNDQGLVTIQTRGGFDGLPRGEYELWLEPPEEFQKAGLRPSLLQTAKARSTKGLKLRRDSTQSTVSLTELPVTVDTLEGFTLTIRQVQDGIGPGPVFSSRTISRIIRYP